MRRQTQFCRTGLHQMAPALSTSSSTQVGNIRLTRHDNTSSKPFDAVLERIRIFRVRYSFVFLHVYFMHFYRATLLC